MQAIVVEELARASMSMLEAEPEAPRASEDVVALWAGKRTRRKVRTLDRVRLVKAESSEDGEADDAAGRARRLRVGVAVTAASALVVAVVALIVALAS